MASAAQRGIAVADLARFRRVTTIPLDQTPGQVLRAATQVFVTCPEAHALCEIDPVKLRAAGRIDLPGRIAAAAVTPDGASIAVLVDQPAALLLIHAAKRRVAKRIALPHAPAGLDVTGALAAVTSASQDAVMRVSLDAGKLAGVTGIGGGCGPIRFRMDGKTILVGAQRTRQVVTLDALSGSVLARLPLPFAPERFCFIDTEDDRGGQMFVTGTGEDAIAIVEPYQNQVDQTIVAGRNPFGMAFGVSGSRNLLFVTNPGSGDLTIFDVDTRQLAASVHVGGNPGEVLLTPNGEYALAINRDSGDVAVVRISTVLNRGIEMAAKPLLTVFATGAGPQSAAIIPLPA